MKNKAKRIMCNSGLLVIGLIWVAIMIAICLFFIIGINDGQMIKVKTEADGVGIQRIMWIMLAMVCIISLAVMPQWTENIVLGKTSIGIGAFLKKRKEYAYSQYPRVYRAYYYHYWKKVDFIVLSQTILSNYDLQHINNVKHSEKIIIIKYSEANYRALREALPNKQRRELDRAFACDGVV